MQMLRANSIPVAQNRGPGRARDFLSRVWRVVHGASDAPLTYALVIVLFLRALGIVYLIAFASLAVQVLGLYGSRGILPVADFIARQPSGPLSVWAIPTVFWLNTSDVFLQAVPLAGALLSAALVIFAQRGDFIRRAILVLLFVLYLSLVAAGQDFMAYQWDYLLLEVGFIAIFLGDGAASHLGTQHHGENTQRDDAPPANLILWLYRWLLFRLMLLSGLVKILSGDPAWRNLTALDYHFETQPLPNVIGFYVYHLPGGVHQGMVAATFLIELLVPFLIFAPRRIRFAAGALIALLQLQIFFTGNFNFFNLIVIALCILLLDDAALRAIAPVRVLPYLTPRPAAPPKRIARWLAYAVAVVLFTLSAFQFLALFRVPIPGMVNLVDDMLAPLRVVNFYGPFAVMTTLRPEIVIEGSNDGENWLAYEFKYKPGDVRRAPPFVEPYQPRLDWQMWFAALGVRTGSMSSLLPELRSSHGMFYYLDKFPVDAWFINFLTRLLQGSPEVLALLDKNPFLDAPPRLVRARLYEYHFTEPEAPFTRGEWWTRSELGVYFPVFSVGTAANK